MLKSYLLQVFTLPETNKQKALKMATPWKFGKYELGKTTIFGGLCYPSGNYITHPIKNHVWVDDFPFPKLGYVNSLEGMLVFCVSAMIGVYRLELHFFDACFHAFSELQGSIQVQQWPQRLGHWIRWFFGDRFTDSDSESVLYLREYFWKDSKNWRFSSRWRALVMNWRPVGCFFASL